MRTIETTVYKFEELTEEAQQKAVENLYDINLDHWHESIYEDAKMIEIKIKSFDIDRGQIEVDSLDSIPRIAELILENHGKECETYKIAEQYMKEHDELGEDDDYDEIDNNFMNDIGEEYLSILKKEFEYKTSKEAIIETIQANDYEFTEEGKLI